MQKNQLFCNYSSKFILTSYLRSKIFLICDKKFQNWVAFFWKGFENKSRQSRAHYLKPRRNGGPISTSGGARRANPPTPALIRVKLTDLKKFSQVRCPGNPNFTSLKPLQRVYLSVVHSHRLFFQLLPLSYFPHTGSIHILVSDK